MGRVRRSAAIIIFFFMVGYGIASPAAQEANLFHADPRQLELLTERLKAHAQSFRRSVKEAIANNALHDAPIGVYISGAFTWEFEWLADRLNARIKDRKPSLSEAQELLNRAQYIETFMSSYELAPQAERDWQLLSADLDQLAQSYRIRTRWKRPEIQGIPQPVETEALENRLRGTYQLETSQSADLRKIVNRLADDLPSPSRRRILTKLTARLKDPELLAIDRQGDRVTLASSLQAARVYPVRGKADITQGERPETQLAGGQFRINSADESDDRFSVIYNSIYLGSGLEVTRIAILPQLKRPIVVVSRYKKVSDLPRLKIYSGE